MSDLTEQLRKCIPGRLKPQNVIFLCIGTDRSTGDSYGPLVGTMLRKIGFSNVYGTLDDTVHAMNLNDIVQGFHRKKRIIAIDACLGRLSSVGSVKASKGSIRPGSGVGKDIGKVGDYHIKAVVNVGGYMEYFVLQNTRLSLVMELAEKTVAAISEVFGDRIVAEAAATTEGGEQEHGQNHAEALRGAGGEGTGHR